MSTNVSGNRSSTALASVYVEAGFSGSGGPLSVCARKSCTAPAEYQLTFHGCGVCEYQGYDKCYGHHTLCGECTARLRERPPAWVGPLATVRTFGSGRSTSADSSVTRSEVSNNKSGNDHSGMSS